MSTTGATAEAGRQTSLAAWDIPTAVAAGEHFSLKVGAKSSDGAPLGGGRIELRDGAGAVLASGVLGDAPWPGSEALYWAEIALPAPAEPGALTLTARFDGKVQEPHDPASSEFQVSVVARAEHTLTVTVAAEGTPLADALVRLGPYRAPTDAAGIARVQVATGQYDLVVWKTGYEMTTTPVAIEADAAIAVATEPIPEENPDAIWTA